MNLGCQDFANEQVMHSDALDWQSSDAWWQIPPSQPVTHSVECCMFLNLYYIFIYLFKEIFRIEDTLTVFVFICQTLGL